MSESRELPAFHQNRLRRTEEIVPVVDYSPPSNILIIPFLVPESNPKNWPFNGEHGD